MDSSLYRWTRVSQNSSSKCSSETTPLLSPKRKGLANNLNKERVVFANTEKYEKDWKRVSRYYKGNKIRTTKYSLLSFLPKNLFEQFYSTPVRAHLLAYTCPTMFVRSCTQVCSRLGMEISINERSFIQKTPVTGSASSIVTTTSWTESEQLKDQRSSFWSDKYNTKWTEFARFFHIDKNPAPDEDGRVASISAEGVAGVPAVHPLPTRVRIEELLDFKFRLTFNQHWGEERTINGPVKLALEETHEKN
ncbi:hypothetical protein XELAEV_18020062mg [Xenopus laevis]|uniref:P-type ATPase N-terminal domain-containing protein n=1 Tax=Xenopus laevis TaxID=8355 RepID=A0A974D804_XENLA|nr:hypothetical protein XELAEV_18020062mg [Xenopus laevis]